MEKKGKEIMRRKKKKWKRRWILRIKVDDKVGRIEKRIGRDEKVNRKRKGRKEMIKLGD